MAKLSNHQVLDLAYKVGWKEAGDLERTLAVVLAESGGNTMVTSPTGCCHGLMQINLNSTSKTKQQLFDAETNMKEGYRLWSERGWQPWNSSRAGQLLRGPEARASSATWHLSPRIGTSVIPSADELIKNSAPGVGEAVEGFNKLRDWLTTPANVGRLATGIIGTVIIIVGLAVLASPTAAKIASAVK